MGSDRARYERNVKFANIGRTEYHIGGEGDSGITIGLKPRCHLVCYGIYCILHVSQIVPTYGVIIQCYHSHSGSDSQRWHWTAAIVYGIGQLSSPIECFNQECCGLFGRDGILDVGDIYCQRCAALERSTEHVGDENDGVIGDYTRVIGSEHTTESGSC